MIDGKPVGEMLRDANEAKGSSSANLNRGGNLGMAILAAGVSEHAQAIQSLADAMNTFAKTVDEALQMAKEALEDDK